MQPSGTPVRVKIDAPNTGFFDGAVDVCGAERITGCHFDLIVYEERPTPGLDEVEIREIEPGVFDGTAILFCPPTALKLSR